jgi:hypothetical protein
MASISRVAKPVLHYYHGMTSLAVARAEDVENVLIDDISWVTFDLFL